MTMQDVSGPDDVAGDREVPSINARKRKSGAKGVVLLIGVAAAVLLLASLYIWYQKDSNIEATAVLVKEDTGGGQKLTFSEDAPPPPPPPAEFLEDGSDLNVPAVEGSESLSAQTAYPRTVEEASAMRGQPGGQVPAPYGTGSGSMPGGRPIDKSASPLMKGGSSGNAGGLGTAKQVSEDVAALIRGAGGMAAGGPADDASTDSDAGLGGLLQGSAFRPEVARRSIDRNYLLPKGAVLDCVTGGRIDTTVPGLLGCTLTRDIYSDNGKVVLLDRGSKIDGEYSAGLQQGQNRLFVVWTEVKTPTGVRISLNSPGTDALGASGVPGKVKTHFWKRFGAAMLVSVIDDGLAAAAAQHSSSGTTVNLGNSANTASDLASKILESTVNIRPTLYQRHGARVSIIVARDLDFRGVYSLAAE